MLKGHLDALVLAALESGPTHGYAIIETIRARSRDVFDLPEGTVYPALHRLEKAGLLKSAWVVPEGGRKRRVYELTKKGKDGLVARRASWARFAAAIEESLSGRSPWPA